MTKTIDELKAKHAKELAEAERIESIRAILPVKPDVARIMLFGGRAHVSYQADSLADALVILAAFDRVPFTQARDTFLSHKPADWYKEGELERSKDTLDGCAVMLTIDGAAGASHRYGPTAKLRQWARLSNGEVIQLGVALGVYPSGKGYPIQWLVSSNVRYNRGGEVIEAKHTAPRICGDMPMITWSAGSREAYNFSWLWMEQGTLDNEMSRYLPKEVQA